MSGPSATRLLARAGLRSTFRPAATPRCTSFLATRAFSLSAPRSNTTPPKREPPKKTGGSILSSLYSTPSSDQSSIPASLSKDGSKPSDGTNMMDILSDSLKSEGSSDSTRPTAGDFGRLASDAPDAVEPYHFHIYSHKHNTHVTVSKPDRGAIISMSTGNLGFRKQRRKTYDAAYQLTAYVLERLKYAGWEKKINRMELVLRGFGQGREAGVKVLMSPEGTRWREKIIRVADATRVKFGGTRSRNPRRL